MYKFHWNFPNVTNLLCKSICQFWIWEQRNHCSMLIDFLSVLLGFRKTPDIKNSERSASSFATLMQITLGSRFKGLSIADVIDRAENNSLSSCAVSHHICSYTKKYWALLLSSPLLMVLPSSSVKSSGEIQKCFRNNPENCWPLSHYSYFQSSWKK